MLASALLLLIVFMALAMWQGYRGSGDVAEATLARDRLAPEVAALQARQERGPPGAFDMGLKFRRDGQLFGGPSAVTEAQDQLHALDKAIWLASLRTWPPPAVSVGGGVPAALSDDPAAPPVRPIMTHFFYMDEKDPTKVSRWVGSVGPTGF